MKNHENLVNFQKIVKFSMLHNFTFIFHSNKYMHSFLHMRDIFTVHLGKLKLPFSEFLVAMVTGKMCSVGKLKCVPQGLIYILGTVPTFGMFSSKFA